MGSTSSPVSHGFAGVLQSELSISFGFGFSPFHSLIFRPDPEHVKLTSEELSSVIAQQKNNLKEQEEEEGEGDAEETADKSAEMDDEVKVKVEKGEGKDKTEEDIMKEYGLEDYDQEEEGGEANLLGLGDLTSFADPKVRSNFPQNNNQN